MKKQSLLAALLISFIAIKAQKPGAPIDVLHYEFSVVLTDSNDRISGEALIRFRALKEISSVSFDLVSMGADRKGMTVKSVRDEQALSFVHSGEELKIRFGTTVKTGEEKEIRIIYEGVPRDGLIITQNKFGHRGFFADNWPNRAHNWIPCIDHPSDKATVDFKVIAPMHYQVVANGIQSEETVLNEQYRLTRYHETTPIAPKVMVIGAAGFAVNLAGEVDCIPVYSWVYPENRDKGFYDYAQALEILPYYIQHIGPYGYHKLANVQSKTRFGGLENANTIFYSEGSVTGTRHSEGLLAHEIAHQWFGNMATEIDWAHLWLSEGFATYMTICYLENKYGADTALDMLREDRSQAIAWSQRSDRPVVDSSVTDYMKLLNANSYQKGGWVLHMLRCQLGDSLFWRSIRSYYAVYAGKNASTEDLQKIFEKESGKDLRLFFRQWLYTAGQPDLDISWEYNKEKKLLQVHIVQQQAILFQFPLEMRITGGGLDGTITKSIQVNQKQTDFSIPMEQEPLTVEVDPGVKLLFSGKVRKSG